MQAPGVSEGEAITGRRPETLDPFQSGGCRFPRGLIGAIGYGLFPALQGTHAQIDINVCCHICIGLFGGAQAPRLATNWA
jgi:hypothetical protein